MSRARNLPTGDGYSVCECGVCAASPVRDDGTEVLSAYNWLRTCGACKERACRVCMPEDATICVGCTLAALPHRVGTDAEFAAARAELFGQDEPSVAT